MSDAEVGEPKARKKKLPAFLNVPWNLRDVLVFIVAWIGIQVVLSLVLMAVAPIAPGIAHFLKLADGGDVAANLALDLVNAGVGLGVISWYLHKYQVGWTTVGWRRVNLLKAILYLVGILVVFVVAANLLLMLVTALVPGFDPNQAQKNDFNSGTKAHTSLALIALVLLPPVLEETIFRGFLFPALSKRMGLVWGAIISSVIFGLAHMQANISVYTFVLGLLLCFMYVRTKSIIPGIFLHMLNNYLAFIAFTNK